MRSNFILLGHRVRLKPLGFKRVTPIAPPRFIEYAYYFSLFYSIMSVSLDLSVKLLGGSLLAALAAYCILRLGPRRRGFYTSIALPLCCAFSLVGIQLILHNESLQSVRPWLTWVLLLVIMQSLSLRQGFLRRFAVIGFVFGLATLPYLAISGNPGTNQVDRFRIDASVGFANPNDLAAWFGFFAVYFVISGVERRRWRTRSVSWLAALTCFFIVGLTVSRGTLLAIAIALTVALRRLLKHRFLLLLSLLLFIGLILSSGLFESIIDSYTNRATEETGRLLVWPLAIERFLNSPLTGVGVSNSDTYVPGLTSITPHNSFLGIGLSSGVIPLIFSRPTGSARPEVPFTRISQKMRTPHSLVRY